MLFKVCLSLTLDQDAPLTEAGSCSSQMSDRSASLSLVSIRMPVQLRIIVTRACTTRRAGIQTQHAQIGTSTQCRILIDKEQGLRGSGQINQQEIPARLRVILP